MGNKKGHVWLGFLKVEMYWKVLYGMTHTHMKAKGCHIFKHTDILKFFSVWHAVKSKNWVKS